MAPSLFRALMLSALVLLPSSAFAGRRPFIFTWDSETVAKGDVELEQWIWVRGKMPASATSDCVSCHSAAGAGASSTEAMYWLWWGPVIGITNNIELALPFQMRANSASTMLDSVEADVRIRLRSREVEHFFEPLIRVAYHQPVEAAMAPRIDFNLVSSLGSQKKLHGTLNLGGRIGLPFLGKTPKAHSAVVGTYGAGLAYGFLDGELKLSAEVYGEWAVANLQSPNGFPRHFAGGSLSWTFGRFWLTAGTLVGIRAFGPQAPNVMSRLIWAVAL